MSAAPEAQAIPRDMDAIIAASIEEIAPEASPVERFTLHQRMRLATDDAGRSKRRQVPIMAYVGANGAGKTLAAVHDTIPSLEAGRTVLSTVALINPRTGEPYPNFVPFTDWNQLLDLRHADVLMDEIVGIAASTEHASVPTQAVNIMMQLRRRDVCLRWTAPAWARAVKSIREVTKGVTLCSGHLPKPPARNPDGSKSQRMWAENRLFWWRTYDATTFEEFTLIKAQSLGQKKTAHNMKSSASALYWRPGRTAEGTYRTLDEVSRVGQVSGAGLCIHCHGRRPVPQCRCDDPPRVEPPAGRRSGHAAHSPRTAAVTAASLTRSTQ
jgi:hypothetical protein